ncbi:uncharacterized protein LOC122855319 [Aphidius gifuensis]|uniref:uncharacterized protein LOC122855319 n=1 Tax=Aphidius gifuensis TaxID=684658 RepID=UPI001CDBB552|nr:uncharacterized protein LOC122855319 [Aphidius gifuensis]
MSNDAKQKTSLNHKKVTLIDKSVVTEKLELLQKLKEDNIVKIKISKSSPKDRRAAMLNIAHSNASGSSNDFSSDDDDCIGDKRYDDVDKPSHDDSDKTSHDDDDKSSHDGSDYGDDKSSQDDESDSYDRGKHESSCVNNTKEACDGEEDQVIVLIILREIVDAVGQALREYNTFAKSYQMMHEELQRLTIGTEEPEMQLLFTLKPGMDARRYNPQKVNEVAALFTTTADGDIPELYVTVHNKKSKNLQFISSMDPTVEPLVYPLFYPHGTLGWHSNIACWIVDNYVKIEKDRMTFCRNNQKSIRADTYQGLIDHLQQQANSSNQQLGKMVVLPSSFTGSPRNMLQHYQDAMAIVRKFGKPDLFVTMTCNPNWREIQENLLPGQTSSDRPDIVSRVFNIKKEELITTIVKKKLFGETLAYVYVIEYQKRGLPHIHLLIILKSNHKIVTSDVVDKYISAEIPLLADDPILHNIVMKNMIHGPCGAWCKDQNGKCSKHFPKSFQNETIMDENGYPTYRRRNTGAHNRPQGGTADNQYVVPYNATLLKLFNCHINTEIVSSIKSVKYLYKYIYKGHDAAAVEVVDETSDIGELNHDEIRNYIETRYVGPVEACDRIMGRSLQKKSHSIMRLPVHLPNQQSVIISDEGTEDSIRTALEKTTMLIEYFALNQRDPVARQYTYAEIPSHFVFKKSTSSSNKSLSWETRQKQFSVVGRMYSISPHQMELFHLRLLLLTVKGATSFENLRTVDGMIYDTYHRACLARGLIEDDSEWTRALTEGEIWMMPRQLRNLFASILIHCQPSCPGDLWNQFKDALSQDFQRNNSLSDSHCKAYHEINNLLSGNRRSLSDFPSMPPLDDFVINSSADHNCQVAISLYHQDVGQRQYRQLNVKQKAIVDSIFEVVMSDNKAKSLKRCYYVDGPGGSGKTFIYTTLYHLLKSKGKKICTMSFTGVSAILLPNGQTVHHSFGLPVPLFADSTSHIKIQSQEAQIMKEYDLIIWDEGPMAPRYCMEVGDKTYKYFMDNDLPFGGKVMLIGGDFRQLLPVKMNATRTELVNLSIKFSHLWKHFSVLSLTENMRTLPEETEFAKYLLDLGDGILNDNNSNILAPERCVAKRTDDIVEVMFKELLDNRRYDELTTVAVLSARNVDVDEINNRVVELLDKGSEKIYTSIDSTENCDNGDIEDAILPEYLQSLNPPNFPPHELKLRNNCVVMLLRNLSIAEGLCNGTRLQILQLANNLLQFNILLPEIVQNDISEDIALVLEMPLTLEKAKLDHVEKVRSSALVKNVQPERLADAEDHADAEVDDIMTRNSPVSERFEAFSLGVVNTPDSDLGHLDTAVRFLVKQFTKDPALSRDIVRGVTALKRPREDDDEASDAKRSCTSLTCRSTRGSPRDLRTPSSWIPTPTGDFKVPSFAIRKAKQPVGKKADVGSNYDQGKHHDWMIKKNFPQPPRQALARNALDQGAVVTRVQSLSGAARPPAVGAVAAVYYNCRAPVQRYMYQSSSI